MIAFLATLLILILITLFLQLVMKMKLVPPSRLAVVHGKGKGFSIYRGGRVFVLPLINRFSTMDLTPQTNTVVVESAIAKGIVPLTVKATVSYAVSRSEHGMINAVKRILFLTNDWTELNNIAISIIEGHLRDSIAAMTPEEVMSHKDRLIQNMIQTCKADLEGIGLEITTMNIADVEDHRLEGVKEPDLYIALLKRIQTANAESQSREAKATARAAAKEQEETRRAEVAIRSLENERQSIEAQTQRAPGDREPAQSGRRPGGNSQCGIRGGRPAGAGRSRKAKGRDGEGQARGYDHCSGPGRGGQDDRERQRRGGRHPRTGPGRAEPALLDGRDYTAGRRRRLDGLRHREVRRPGPGLRRNDGPLPGPACLGHRRPPARRRPHLGHPSGCDRRQP